ncbi:MAG: hypothetical protein PHQ09_04655 [Actinomycetota bacterium]|nr:hypothetical protein [Actinomycetota bacterium]
MVKNKNIKSKVIRVVLLVVVVCFIAAGIFQLIKYNSVKRAIILATTKKPSTFTELYFENHLSLPDKVTLFEENNFKFTIHNLENKDMEYPYEVYIDTNGEKQIICTDSVLIEDDEYETIAVDFTITIPIPRSMVIVNLIDKNEQISFWIEEE